MRLPLLTGALFLLAAVAQPAAASVQPLPPTAWVLPADGASRPASSWPAATPFEMVSFTIYVYEPYLLDGEFDIEVAASPTTDPDGTLADAGRLDHLVATPRPGYEGIFAARTDVAARWVGTPGTYYWRAYFTRTDPAAGCEPCVYGSPLQTLVVMPKPPPDAPAGGAGGAPAAPPPAQAPGAAPSYGDVAPLTLALARKAVRDTIRRRTGKRPRGLRDGCVLATAYDATCRPSWRDARHRYRGTMFVWAGADGIGASFDGARTKRGCRGGAPRCRRPVRW